MIGEMSFLWIIFACIRRKAHYTLLHSDQCRRHKCGTCSIGSSGTCLGVWGASTWGNFRSTRSRARQRTVGICKSILWGWRGKGHNTRRNICFQGLDRPGIRYFIFPCVIQWDRIKEELFTSTGGFHYPFYNRLLYLRIYWCTASVGSIILLSSASIVQKWYTLISCWICVAFSIQQVS